MLVACLAVFAAAVPLFAHAGFFSFINGLLTAPASSADVTKELARPTRNSQNVALLRAALNPDPNPSKGGGDITVVGGTALLSEAGPSGTLADITVRPDTDQINIYVVREGDSLSQIADMFGVSVNTIVWANDIKSGSVIHAGQTLVILPVTGVRHTVESGDTLASIAKQYEGDAKEIRQYNGLGEDATLAVGDELIIPHGEIPMPKQSASQARSSSRVVPGVSGPSYDGYYIRPVRGGVLTQGLHGYNAVDIGVPFGTPIVAAADGTVIISRASGWNGGYGNYIAIRHDNGTQTLYAHNTRNIVYVGQSVVQGQVIGYSGSTGQSTGPHIHFEIRGAKNPFVY